MTRILIVEDERQIAEIERDYLQSHGYETHLIERGDDVVPWLKAHDADLILLDVMLPGMDGLQVCKAVREFSQIPIMMLTARIEEIDRILGLELGADDYLCKPFSPREMVARVKALLRRSQRQPSAQNHDFHLDAERYQVVYQERSCPLSAVEFALLKMLSDTPGRIYSRSQLIENIYTDHRVVSDRTVDSHIKKLRHKLAAELTDKEIIHSVYGVGYKFEWPETNEEPTETTA
jgi:two-component system response regulator BaeR